MTLHPAYFDVRFRSPEPPESWPPRFAVITAHATTGHRWTAGENEQADARLRERLDEQNVWKWRLTGYSPTTDHAEPGWATVLGFKEACDLGEQFLQDAIYFVEDDTLFVSFCDARRQLVRVGDFRERVGID